MSQNHKDVLHGLGLLLVFIFVIVHFFLLVAYGTPFPCEAAARRLVEADYAGLKPKTGAEALGQVAGRSMTENLLFRIKYMQIRQQSKSYCYAIALRIK